MNSDALLREYYPASMVATPAGLLTALTDLGPRPPWWRPFARRRWRRMRDFVLLNYGRPTFANLAKRTSIVTVVRAP